MESTKEDAFQFQNGSGQKVIYMVGPVAGFPQLRQLHYKFNTDKRISQYPSVCELPQVTEICPLNLEVCYGTRQFAYVWLYTLME